MKPPQDKEGTHTVVPTAEIKNRNLCQSTNVKIVPKSKRLARNTEGSHSCRLCRHESEKLRLNSQLAHRHEKSKEGTEAKARDDDRADTSPPVISASGTEHG